MNKEPKAVLIIVPDGKLEAFKERTGGDVIGVLEWFMEQVITGRIEQEEFRNALRKE